jgi:hypothetical protein
LLSVVDNADLVEELVELLTGLVDGENCGGKVKSAEKREGREGIDEPVVRLPMSVAMRRARQYSTAVEASRPRVELSWL